MCSHQDIQTKARNKNLHFYLDSRVKYKIFSNNINIAIFRKEGKKGKIKKEKKKEKQTLIDAFTQCCY